MLCALMLDQLFKIVSLVLVSIGALLYLGLGIGSTEVMPGYAAVYLDDDTKTYIALPCIGDWHKRPGEKFAFARLAKAKDAWQLHYNADADCRAAGGHVSDGRSATGLLLVRLGILSPAKHWWDAPYRTDEGVVVMNPASQ